MKRPRHDIHTQAAHTRRLTQDLEARSATDPKPPASGLLRVDQEVRPAPATTTAAVPSPVSNPRGWRP
jgi:hypothetical protein